MYIWVNNCFPPKGYTAICLWPFILTREPLEGRGLRHELIHGRQETELLLLLFYILYGLMYLIELVRCLFKPSRGQTYYKERTIWKRAYRMIPFEREAYGNAHDEDYLKERTFCAWIHYMD